MATDYLININMQDPDVLQQMCLQDADLGFNWQPSETSKQLKEIEDACKKTSMPESILYEIDGETGEQIAVPAPQKSVTPIQAAQTSPDQTQVPCAQTNIFNIEEYLDMIDTSTDGVQSQIHQNVQQGVINVDNLTSLLEPADNGTAVPEPNESIWDDIADLSVLTGLNLHNPQNVGPTTNGQIAEGDIRLEGSSAPTNHPTAFNLNSVDSSRPALYKQRDFSFSDADTVYDTQPSNVYESAPVRDQSVTSSPPSAFLPQSRLSPCSSSSSRVSDEGLPMLGSSSPLTNSGMSELNLHPRQFDNFNAAMETNEPSLPVGGGQRTTPPAAAYEPGQLFFDQGQPSNVSSLLGDLMLVDTAVSTPQNNLSDAFLNPSSSPFHPPPLSKSSPISIMTFPDEQENRHLQPGDTGMLAESYESDSGVSMGHSPQDFSFLEAVVGDDLALDGVDPQTDQFFDESDLMTAENLDAIHHNHTYNGTVGAKNKTKKKASKSASPRESRDMRKARELNIPFTLDEIIMSPVEEYNEMLARTPLSQAQQTLIKDIRRRGKNKVAAQNCRKRKIETITHMEEDVEALRIRKQLLLDEQQDLEKSKDSVQLKYNALYQQIFSALRDESGRPYDFNRFSLEQVEGAVILVPRIAPSNRVHDNEQAMEHDLSEVDLSKVKVEKE